MKSYKKLIAQLLYLHSYLLELLQLKSLPENLKTCRYCQKT